MTMNIRKGWPWVLLLLTFTLVVTVFTVSAEGVSPYRIVLTAPGGWTDSQGAVIKATVSDPESIGWQKIEYRLNQGSWSDCEDLFDQNKAEITVYENGTFTLRVTGPNGEISEETAEVTTIDRTPPVVDAGINGTTLHIDIRDDLSGVAGVQVNSMLFTTVTGGKLDVELDQEMNQFERLAVRAFDYAGNFSEPVSMDNPHYQKPADPTPEPTATVKPTKKPAPTKETEETKATPAPVTVLQPDDSTLPAATERPGLGSSLIYVSDEDIPVATAVPTVAPTPEPIIEKEYITIGPGMPYLADGNSHTLDVLYSAATNKQFITLQSKSGNTFYLVIDYDKPIDEDAEMYETHFLNLVDERDLLALMSDEEKEEVPTPTPEIIYVTPEPTAVPQPTTVPVETEKQEGPDQMTAILALAAIVLLAGVGAFLFFRNKGKGNTRSADTDFDLDEDDTEDSGESAE